MWRLRVYVGRDAKGQPVQRSKTVRTGDGRPGSGVREADRELAKLVSEVAKGNLATGTETVGELLDRFLEHAEAIGRSPTTLKEYRRIAETILRPELGRLPLVRLTAVDLDRLYAKLIARGLKPTTVRHVHALIGVALHQGEKWGLVDRNVSRRATPPPVHPTEVEPPNVEEVRAIIAAAEEVEPPFAAMLIITALVGARRGEMCGLRWSDFDSIGRTLTIARSVYDAPGRSWGVKDTKTHAKRRVSLDDLAVEVLRRHRARVDALARELGVAVAPDAYIFSRSPAGLEPYLPDVVTQLTIRVAKRAGVDTHLHALRHFSATEAIAAGYDVVTVAGRLGHADPSITLRTYSHVIEARDRELAASLGRKLAPAPLQPATVGLPG